MDPKSVPTKASADPLAPLSTGSKQTPASILRTPSGELAVEPTVDTRYEGWTLLERGGMGEIGVCTDARFGREVAKKVIRGGPGAEVEARTRFLREARVQGQLEHPAIVPIYDLGQDAEGNLYFTMKRVRGLTLEQVLDRLHAGDPRATARYSRHKLLAAFLDVCQAVHFAHARGVIHRDLKPANIMLGSYGEVYVLDWGVAKIMGSDDPALSAVDASTAVAAGPPATAVGDMIGTAGYMAPEQINGSDVDARTDVYALGAVLFEILAQTPLHGDGPMVDILAHTMNGSDARPSARAPSLEIPPELDDVCVRATSLTRTDRYESARELGDAVESFLSGDRDLERRKALAEEAVQRAVDLAQKAMSASGVSDDGRRAWQEAGRALALDPSNPAAVTTIARLLAEPQRDVPVEVRRRLARKSSEFAQRAMRASALPMIPLVLFFAPATWWMGWRVGLVASVALLLVWPLSALSMYVAYRGGQSRESAPLLAVTALAAVSLAGFFGPFILLPTIVSVMTVNSIMMMRRPAHRWTVALGCLTFLLPAGLQLLGVLPAYAFEQGVMKVRPLYVELPAIPTQTILCVMHVGLIVASAFVAAHCRRLLDETEERSAMQTWKLQQLFPSEVQGALQSTPPPPDATAVAIRA